MALSHKLEPGLMRHRIQIVQPSGVQDSFGGVTTDAADWSVVMTCWARIESLTGRDQYAAGTFVSMVSHRITIRNPREAATIGPNMRVWFQGRVFIIQAVLNPDETNKMLYLVVTEIAVATQPAPNAATNQ